MNKNEPKPKTASLEAPKELSDNGKKHWNTVAKQLKDARVLTELDVPALVIYCEAYARWCEANDMVKKHGIVVKSNSGFPIQSPYLAISNKAFDQMKGMLIEFGMTPSSRTRVQVEEKKDEEASFGVL